MIIKNLTKISINEIILFIENLQVNKSRINDILIASIKLYASALDTTDYSNAFLSLWQSLETITMLSSERYSMSEVVDRVLCLINSKNLVYKHFLDLSASRRNDLVHKGIFNEQGQSEVQLLKIICKYCILSFIEKIDKYKTYEKIEIFYKITGLNTTKREFFKEVINSIDS